MINREVHCRHDWQQAHATDVRLALRLHSVGHGAAEQQRYKWLNMSSLHSSPHVIFLMFPHPVLLRDSPLRSQMRLQCAESARSGLL